jgi:hypothetical protein
MSSAFIVTEASHALRRSRHPALRRLKVQNSEGALIISGRVPTWHLKQLAQEALMPVRGPLKLVNSVDVSR